MQDFKRALDWTTLSKQKKKLQAKKEPNNFIFSIGFQMHRAGQRCFELLALIGSPQLL